MLKPAAAGFNMRDIEARILPGRPHERNGALARMLTKAADCSYSVSAISYGPAGLPLWAVAK
jgi:hypothetical protein